MALYAPAPGIESSKFLEDFRKEYLNNFRVFQQVVSILEETAAKTTTKEQVPNLQNQLTKTRLAYKRIEFIFDYYESSYNYMKVNGGPLPKVDKENALVDIVAPNGLQTLDELIYSDQPFQEIEGIRKLSSDLVTDIDFIAQSHPTFNLGEKQLIEAIRTGLIRVFTLGVTGFDTPGSGNGLLEAETSFQAMHQAFLFFDGHHEPEAKKAFCTTDKLFKKAAKVFQKNKDFDTFDRMSFLKEIINPLYKSMLHFRVDNGVNADRFRYHAHNYDSENVFAEDFLDRSHYSEFTYFPLEHPASIALGRALFFDPILSKNKDMACSSCHDPKKAFADGLPKSATNQSGHYTKRNSPTLINAAYSSRFFWDLREFNLERQVAHVVSDSMEFNISFKEITDRLNRDPNYRQQFADAYKGISKQDINSQSISNAIAAYVSSLSSFNSPFDRYVRNEEKTYSQDAIKGFNLFMGKAACGTCHFAPVFNGMVPPFYLEAESEVLGVTDGFDTLRPMLDADKGRLGNGLNFENYPHFAHSFKTVTVRNSALTAPYMHNGSFKTLEEVMEFYDLGGGVGMGLALDNQTLSADPLLLTEAEKGFIVEFLETLSEPGIFQ